MTDSSFQKNKKKEVSIILAVLNEERHICRCLDSLLKQEFYDGNYEIIIVDGMSTDRTRGILRMYQEKFPNVIKLFDNPKRYQSVGRNIGVQNAKYEIVLIFDGHAIAERWYLYKVARSLKNAPPDVAGVGGRHSPPFDETFLGKVIANVQKSPLGGAGTSYRVPPGRDKFVNTLSGFCAYKKDIITNLGLYDERFHIAEDAELNWRIKRAGYRLLSINDATVYYYRRYDSLKLLSKKMLSYGIWRMLLAKKYPASFGIVFCLPIIMVLSVALLPLFLIISLPLAQIVSIALMLYLAAIILSSSYISFKNKSPRFFVSGIVYPIVHLCIGIGLMAGLVKRI